METTNGKARGSIFPMIFFFVFLAFTAIATVVTASGDAPNVGAAPASGVATP
jgi:hypothetical protein